MKTSSRHKLRSYPVLLMAMFLLLLPGISKASSIWVGKMGNSWQDAMNWFPTRVPGPADDVIIQVFFPGVAPVIDMGTVRIKSLEVSISGSLGSKPGTSITVLGTTDINGSMTLSTGDAHFIGNLYGSGYLDGGSANIYVGGSMTITHFTARNSTVIFNGTSSQSVLGYFFNNLTMSKASTDVYLDNATTVKNALQMTGGNINLNGQTLTLGNAATNPGMLNWGTGFFTGAGSFKRWFGAQPVMMGTMAGLFPMGVSGNNRSLWVSTHPQHGGVISVSHTNGTGTYYFNPAYNDKGGNLVVNTRTAARWSVSTDNAIDGFADISVRGDGIQGSTDYKLMCLSLVNCAAPGAYMDPSGSNKNPMVSRGAIPAANLNNDFYIAYYHTISPLTSVLISNSDNSGGTNLTWAAETQAGFNRFDLERSSDGTNWYSIGSVDAGVSSQLADTAAAVNPNFNGGIENYSYTDNTAGKAGATYYRVKLVKPDGYYEYSEAKSVVVPFSLLAYPNPVTDLLHLKWEGSEFENAELHITDMNGRVLYEQNINGHGVSDIQIDIAGYKPGNYIVQLFSGTQSVSKTISKH